jgi:hypothetical protein
MKELDELEALARAAELASVMPWERSQRDVPYAHKKQFHDLVTPAVILRLVAIARAAEALLNPNTNAHDTMAEAALRAALAGTQGGGKEE